MADYTIPTPVHVSIPEDPEQLALLRGALGRMGLQYLLRIPWNVQLGSYVKDFHNDAPIRRRFQGYSKRGIGQVGLGLYWKSFPMPFRRTERFFPAPSTLCTIF